MAEALLPRRRCRGPPGVGRSPDQAAAGAFHPCRRSAASARSDTVSGVVAAGKLAIRDGRQHDKPRPGQTRMAARLDGAATAAVERRLDYRAPPPSGPRGVPGTVLRSRSPRYPRRRNVRLAGAVAMDTGLFAHGHRIKAY